MNLHIFPTAQAAADAVAAAFARAARDAVTARGAFHVALSGGSTPRRMYSTLREPAGHSLEVGPHLLRR